MPRENATCVSRCYKSNLDKFSINNRSINFFIYYFKKLDAEQMELLIGSAGACNPLWLSLSCEELRVFGVFETITHHIRSLPATLKELLQFIINRLTNEDQENNIHQVFYFCVAASISCLYAGNFHRCLESGLLAGSFLDQRLVIAFTGTPTWRVVDFSCPTRIWHMHSKIFHVSLTSSRNFMLLSNILKNTSSVPFRKALPLSREISTK